MNAFVKTMNIITIKCVDLDDFLQTYYGINKTDEVSTAVSPSSIKKHIQPRSKKGKPIIFFDQGKYLVKLWATMDQYTKSGPLPLSTTKPCWYCRVKINGQPLGCPLKYVSQEKDVLELEMFKIFLKENNFEFTDQEISILEYFESEGMFCDLSCIKTYILEQISLTKHPKYSKALTLLSLLQQKLFGTNDDIKLANSWKMLQDWGGHFSASEFRSMKGKRTLQPTINLKRPLMYSSSTFYQEYCSKV